MPAVSKRRLGSLPKTEQAEAEGAEGISGWKKWTEALFDLILPRRCAGCGRVGTWLCPSCVAALPQVEPPLCPHCGLPTPEQALCPACWQARSHLKGIRAPYYFEGTIRPMVHRLKYRRGQHLAEPLGLLMARYLDTHPLASLDALVPVPLHRARLRERGFNQSALLARAVAAHSGLPLIEECVERVRDTPAQMGLPARERAANVRGAFRATDPRLAGMAVLLVDDVCTTGATLEACADALKRSGAKDVWALVLARAASFHAAHRGESG